MFVVLLGYFKAKPVVLQPRYFQIKDDLKYVSENALPGGGHKPFNLSSKESERIYQRIFSLCQYERWRSELHEKALVGYLRKQATVWSDPRDLFDSAIEFLSTQQITIPAYSTLQKLISQVVVGVHSVLVKRLNASLSDVAKQAMAALLEGKELAVHRYVAQWMPEVPSGKPRLAGPTAISVVFGRKIPSTHLWRLTIKPR